MHFISRLNHISNIDLTDYVFEVNRIQSHIVMFICFVTKSTTWCTTSHEDWFNNVFNGLLRWEIPLHADGRAIELINWKLDFGNKCNNLYSCSCYLIELIGYLCRIFNDLRFVILSFYHWSILFLSYKIQAIKNIKIHHLWSIVNCWIYLHFRVREFHVFFYKAVKKVDIWNVMSHRGIFMLPD